MEHSLIDEWNDRSEQYREFQVKNINRCGHFRSLCLHEYGIKKLPVHLANKMKQRRHWMYDNYYNQEDEIEFVKRAYKNLLLMLVYDESIELTFWIFYDIDDLDMEYYEQKMLEALIDVSGNELWPLEFCRESARLALKEWSSILIFDFQHMQSIRFHKTHEKQLAKMHTATVEVLTDNKLPQELIDIICKQCGFIE